MLKESVYRNNWSKYRTKHHSTCQSAFSEAFWSALWESLTPTGIETVYNVPGQAEVTAWGEEAKNKIKLGKMKQIYEEVYLSNFKNYYL